MNKLYFILFLLILFFISYDGRYRIHKSNEDILKEANLFESFSEELKFIPEEYTEITTDTLLSNGFNIKINYHSIEDNFVLKTSIKENDTVTLKNHKNFEAQFQVSKNNDILFKSNINKALFYTEKNKSFLENAIMQHVWVNYNASTENSVQLNTSFRLAETDKFKDFILIIFDDGTMRIKEINNNIRAI